MLTIAKTIWKYLVAPQLLKNAQALGERLTRRVWRYLTAVLTGKLDELADPKVQIEQAIAEAKRQHELLSQQAAAVLGNRRQLELKLSRMMGEVEKLQGAARQALMLAGQASSAGDTGRAASYEDAARTLARKLVAVESSMRDVKNLHDEAVCSAKAAKQAVEQNAFGLQKKLAERAKLLSQLEHTKMQESMNEAVKAVSELALPGSTPTLEQVRDKIDARYARAMGEAEIASGSAESRMLEVEIAAIDARAELRLESIRASLDPGSPSPDPERRPASQQ